MTEISLDNVRRIRDRQWLLDREQELTNDLDTVDAEQRRLAARFGRLRRELEQVHELLWPPTPGYEHRKSYRPRLPGPAHVPPASSDSVLLRGRALRRAALAELRKAGRPLALPELHRALHLTGHRLTSEQPAKQLADALRYEELRGRVRRVERGTYAASN